MFAGFLGFRLSTTGLSRAGDVMSSIVRRNPHAITASGGAAPATSMVLRCVVKEGAAIGIRASFDEREVSVTQQIAGRLRDRHHQLLWLAQI
jgi:hypothetical protein